LPSPAWRHQNPYENGLLRGPDRPEVSKGEFVLRSERRVRENRTALRLIAGWSEPTYGAVRVATYGAQARALDRALCFRSRRDAWTSVRENVRLGA